MKYIKYVSEAGFIYKNLIGEYYEPNLVNLTGNIMYCKISDELFDLISLALTYPNKYIDLLNLVTFIQNCNNNIETLRINLNLELLKHL